MYKQIHIVGCSPRSGTTLLHEVMISCFRGDKQYDHEKRFNHTEAGDGEVLISKRPKDTQFMPTVLRHVPDFWVMYLLRDPRDVVVSRHAYAKDQYYSNFRLWREQNSFAREMRDHPNFIEVKYEDLVTDPDGVQAEIQRRIPWLEKLHNFSEYHEHAQVSEESARAMHGVRSISSTSVGRWQDNLPRIKGQTAIHGSITPDLIECGYEEDSKWEAILDQVDADLSESHYPDKLNLWHRSRKRANIAIKVCWYRLKRALKNR